MHQTLSDAYKRLDRLRNPDQIKPRLTGIACNVCLRWSRQQGVLAILVSFQDLESPARLEVISSRDSFEMLVVHLVHAT